MKACDTREILAVTGGWGGVGWGGCGKWAASDAADYLYAGENKRCCRTVAESEDAAALLQSQQSCEALVGLAGSVSNLDSAII
jgi:hypothetical protein